MRKSHHPNTLFRPPAAGAAAMPGSMIFLFLLGLPLHAQRQPPLYDSHQPIVTYISEEQRGNRPEDRMLAEWALRAWSNASRGALQFRIGRKENSRLRVYWVGGQSGLYGETRQSTLDGRRVAEVFVRPEIEDLGDEIDARARVDSLFRDTVVYLTCLHEIGHALGLDHTANYEDIMFYFGYGGDILNYFQRYRRRLQRRGDIAQHWGLSQSDIARIRELYPP